MPYDPVKQWRTIGTYIYEMTVSRRYPLKWICLNKTLENNQDQPNLK
jgi:hypothetical protein